MGFCPAEREAQEDTRPAGGRSARPALQPRWHPCERSPSVGRTMISRPPARVKRRRARAPAARADPRIDDRRLDRFSRLAKYPPMPSQKPLINICRYQVKPGKEAEMERLLAVHWPTLHKAGLVTN